MSGQSSMSEIDNGTDGTMTVAYKRKKLPCPHCGGRVEVDVVGYVRLSNEAEEEYRKRVPGSTPEQEWLKTLPENEAALLKNAGDHGLFVPFVAAFQAAHNTRPKNPAKAFLGWLKLCRKNPIPSFALEYFAEQFGGRIDFTSHQSVGGVLSDGRLVQFIPCTYISGESRKFGGELSLKREGSLPDVMQWVRTRNGYVAFKGELFNSLKTRTFGEFARPMIESGSNY